MRRISAKKKNQEAETNLHGESSNNSEVLMLSKVMIVGAGTGGLCLAQGLKQSGIDVSVFERDSTTTDRLQGYRLHISSNGARALEHCLPVTLFKEFLGSAAKSNQAVNFLDSNLKRLLTFAIVDDPHAESREIPVSRITLRKVLLRGLENVMNFEKRFQRYEQRSDGSVVVVEGVAEQSNPSSVPRRNTLRRLDFEHVDSLWCRCLYQSAQRRMPPGRETERHFEQFISRGVPKTRKIVK
jgi:hypothetical protein